MRRPTRGLLVALSVAATLTGGAAGAQPVDAPSITLDRTEVNPGEPISIIIEGFQSTSVMVSVCGNEARRGSADCNLPASKGVELSRDAPQTVAQLPAGVPPVPCPCLVRVSNVTNDEVAVAPLTIVGHPVAPVEGPAPQQQVARAPVAVALQVDEASGPLGALMTRLGATTRYEVRVAVRNRTAEPLSGLVLAGTAGRTAGETLATLDLPVVPDLDAGEVWETTVTTELPSMRFGTVAWEVEVSGVAGPVRASAQTSRSGALLGVLLVLLVVDLAVLGFRYLRRRSKRREAPAHTDGTRGPIDVAEPAGGVPELVPGSQGAAAAPGR